MECQPNCGHDHVYLNGLWWEINEIMQTKGTNSVVGVAVTLGAVHSLFLVKCGCAVESY